jgi:hypothetical protein
MKKYITEFLKSFCPDVPSKLCGGGMLSLPSGARSQSVAMGNVLCNELNTK